MHVTRSREEARELASLWQRWRDERQERCLPTRSAPRSFPTRANAVKAQAREKQSPEITRMSVGNHMSPLEAAKEFYTIAVLARELYPDWREPRRPGESCKAPYREDKHPSFSIIPGTGGRLCHDFSEGNKMGPVELVARVFNIPPQPDACRLLVEMYQARCGAAGEPLSPPPPVVEAERNCDREATQTSVSRGGFACGAARAGEAAACVRGSR